MSTPLAKWMDDNRVKDEALAAKIGVSRVQVLRIRRGTCRPSIKTALNIERETNIPAALLVMGDAQ